jgi:hypothetical protein
MTPTAFLPRGRWSAGLPLLLGCCVLAGPVAPARAQQSSGIDWGRSPILPPDLSPGVLLGPPPPPAPTSRPHRVRLLGFQPGFLSDPLGLDSDDPPLVDPKPPEVNGGDWITFAHGADNPYFDFRQPGDPGGVGFYRVNTQVQLFDSQTTACSLGLQAVAPAGLQYDGLPDKQGATVVSPAFSLFHALEDGTALQGFVGKHLPVAQAGTTPQLRKDLKYGLAVQRPLVPDAPDALRNLYLSVGALGQYRLADGPASAGPPVSWEVLPGFSWKLADNWWLSGAVVVPVSSTTRTENARWHFTCSFQF